MPEPTETKRQLCRHIFSEGRRCGSPALRHQEFCYHHHTTRRPLALPVLRDLNSTFTLPPAEDRTAIQTSISEVLRRIAANEIEPRRAGLLLYGLQIASLNLPRRPPADLSKPGELVDDIVTDPILGTLAPAADFETPTPEKSIGALLLEEWALIQSGQSPESQDYQAFTRL